MCFLGSAPKEYSVISNFVVYAAFIGISITLPLWLFIGLIIKINSSGPIFFTQSRIGLNGKPFKIFKFRTMKTDSKNAYLITKIKQYFDFINEKDLQTMKGIQTDIECAEFILKHISQGIVCTDFKTLNFYCLNEFP